MSDTSAACATFPGRLALQQRVFPSYRLPFFEALATACQGGLAVFAGQPCRGESITSLDPQQTLTQASPLSIFITKNHHFLSPNSPFYLCWQSGLVNWLVQENPDALVVEANPRLRSTAAAIRWIHTRQRPAIGWGLGAPPVRGPLVGLRSGGWPHYLRQFDALIAYSSLGAEQYRFHGYPAERIFVAPNAVTSRPSALPPVHPTGLDRPATILFVGRLQARKRVDNLLRAAAALPTESRPRLQIVGDGPARFELQALARQVYPSAEFPGERTGPDLEPYFASADLFVLPGTGGLAVQQAIAHGLPVIAAQGDGTLDALIRSENGWRVPPSDLPALTEALRAALADIPRLRRMGAESYRIVSEEVNLEVMVDVFIKVMANFGFYPPLPQVRGAGGMRLSNQ